MHFDLDSQEHASFLSFCRPTLLDGPMSLVRFSDSRRGHEGGHGRFDPRAGIYKGYWMYASEVAEILEEKSDQTDKAGTKGPYGLHVIREVSERWAICDDWGDLQRAWVLNIPAGRSLNAWFGLAKFQPRTSTQTQRRTGRQSDVSYGGGSMQLILGLTRDQHRWIRGPLTTLSLSKKKLLEKF